MPEERLRPQQMSGTELHFAHSLSHFLSFFLAWQQCVLNIHYSKLHLRSDWIQLPSADVALPAVLVVVGAVAASAAA